MYHRLQEGQFKCAWRPRNISCIDWELANECFSFRWQTRFALVRCERLPWSRDVIFIQTQRIKLPDSISHAVIYGRVRPVFLSRAKNIPCNKTRGAFCARARQAGRSARRICNCSRIGEIRDEDERSWCINFMRYERRAQSLGGIKERRMKLELRKPGRGLADSRG